MFENDKLTVMFIILSFMFPYSLNFDMKKNMRNKYHTLKSLKNTFNSFSTFTKIPSDQSFKNNCKNSELLSNNILQAECLDEENKNYKVNLIDLNNCLINDNGVLSYKQKGNFIRSCTDCKLKTPVFNNKVQPINFECKCYSRNLSPIKTNINLNDFIYYDNKEGLKCKKIKFDTFEEPKHLDNNCILPRIMENKKFFAVCNKLNIINFEINDCIENINGKFSSGKKFFESCYNCEIQKEVKSYYLGCNCKDENNSIRKEYRPLHEFLEYFNDKIDCLNKSTNFNFKTKMIKVKK